MKVSTPQDMYDSTLFRLRKWHNASVSPTEWEELINEAMMAYLNERADEVEKNQKRIDDLGDLKQIRILIPTNKPLNEFDLQNAAVVQGGGALIDTAPAVAGRFGYFKAMAVGVELDYINNPCEANGVRPAASDEYVKWIPARPARSDFKLMNTENYYHKPQDDRIYYDTIGTTGFGKKLKVITGTESRANRLYIEYLVHPQTILLANNTVNGIDLPIHARREVVNRAVVLRLEQSGDPRLRSKVAVDQLEKA